MEQSHTDKKAQIVYFSHGGGPLPLLGDPGHKAMVEFMVRLPTQLTKPDAILVISAHWEEGTATLLGAQNPPLFYDYYNFPRKTELKDMAKEAGISLSTFREHLRKAEKKIMPDVIRNLTD